MSRPDYLALALRDCGRIELRHEDNGRWHSGTFSDLYALRQEIAARGDRGNLFTSLNAPAVGEATNAMGGEALHDADIQIVSRIFVDFDPVRPSGVPSTADELKAAVDRRNRFVAAQSSVGWPHPALAVSGNGAHALYRCRIRSTPELAFQMTDLYRRWRAEWSDGLVEFDPTVRNPGRICRLYGTVNRKGESTADRPHRLSSISIPTRWSGVSPEQIAEAAELYRPQSVPKAANGRGAAPTGSGDYATLDVVGWFAAHDLYKRSLGGGIHAAHCPWASEHTTESGAYAADTVIFEAKPPGLWPRFFCHHAHCEGRDVTDVMVLLGDADAHCSVAFQRRAR